MAQRLRDSAQILLIIPRRVPGVEPERVCQSFGAVPRVLRHVEVDDRQVVKPAYTPYLIRIPIRLGVAPADANLEKNRSRRARIPIRTNTTTTAISAAMTP